jgi:hypothetical protein
MACDPMTATRCPTPRRDVYRPLQVDPTASDQEIANARRRGNGVPPLPTVAARHESADRERGAEPGQRSAARAAYDGARRRFPYYGRLVGTSPPAAATPTGSPARAPASLVGPIPRVQPPRPSWAAPPAGRDHFDRRRSSAAAPARPWAALRGGRGTRPDGGVWAAAARTAESGRVSDRYCTWCGACRPHGTAQQPRRRARSGAQRVRSLRSIPVRRWPEPTLAAGRAGHHRPWSAA